MFIDTHTKKAMEESICDLMDITVEELYDEMNRVESMCGGNYYIRDRKFKAFIDEHIYKALPNEILFFHLARRLKGTEDDVIGRNLRDLLTTENTLSAAIKKYNIEFSNGIDHIETVYCGKTVDWDKYGCGNSSNMKSRLGYLAIKDFCFNGFAFKDLLYKNLYAQRLSGVPEFVGGLIECLGCRELGHYFMSNSAYYCYEYRIPIDRVIFDGHNLNSTDLKQRHLIRCVLERLSDYADTDIRNMRDYKNPILRLSDDDILPSNYFVKKERITVEMLE